MRRRQVLNVLLGGVLFVMTGCTPRTGGKAGQKWVKELGKVVQDILTDAAKNSEKSEIGQPDKQHPYAQRQCPAEYPVDCGSYCCSSDEACCGGSCGSPCPGGGCCPPGKQCCGRE